MVLIFKILFTHFLVSVCDFVFVSDFHWAYLLSMYVFKDMSLNDKWVFQPQEEVGRGYMLSNACALMRNSRLVQGRY